MKAQRRRANLPALCKRYRVDDLATLIRLSTLELDEKRKKRAALEAQVDKAEGEKRTLLAQLEDERDHPPDALEGGLTQGTFIKVTYARCNALDVRLAALRGLIDEVQEEIRAAFETLKRFEIAQEQRARLAHREALRRETKALDEVGATPRRRHVEGERDGEAG